MNDKKQQKKQEIETSLLERYIQNKIYCNTEEMDEKALASAIKALLQENDIPPKNLN